MTELAEPAALDRGGTPAQRAHPATPTGRASWRSWLALTRPRQWIKNGLVAAAPLAAGTLAHPSVLARTLTAFAAFTLTAIGCYLLNDVADADRDRAHPDKCHRPVAAGEISPLAAAGWGTVFVAAGPGLALGVGEFALAVVVASYALVTLTYSFGLKRVPVLELVLVASGFLLRALAGAAATGVRPSGWFLAAVAAGAAMVVLGKRSAETRLDAQATHRPSLRGYSGRGLRTAGRAVGLLLLGCYTGWALTRPSALEPAALASLAGVALGTARYLWCSEHGLAGAPERLLLHDRTLQFASAVWVLTILVGA